MLHSETALLWSTVLKGGRHEDIASNKFCTEILQIDISSMKQVGSPNEHVPVYDKCYSTCSCNTFEVSAFCACIQ